MANTPPATNISRDAGDTEQDLLFVFALRPPAQACAYDRAAGSYYPHILSDESDVPLPSRRLHVVTDPPQTRVDDDLGAQSVDEESSGLPSPDPSSPGLRTPKDSPPAPRALSTGKDDMPDIHHLLINNRAPAPSVSGSSSLGVKNAAISIVPRETGSATVNRSNQRERNKPQFYQIVVDIPDDEGADINDPDSIEPYPLFIDTGSDDTFGFGEGVRKVNKSSTSPGGFETELRSPWTNAEVRSASGHTLLPHGFDTRLTNDELRYQGFVLGRMSYADKAVAHLVLMEPRTFVLRCYDRKRKLTHPVCLTWRFGVAIGVNLTLWKDPTSGMLGLGPSGIQYAYRRYSNQAVTPPSFLAALEEKLKPIPTSRPGEKIALFFCLRLASECYRGSPGPIQSWMSFNTWPCLRQPAWNDRKIVVCPSEPHHRQWAVYLKSIKFCLVDKSKDRPVPLEDQQHDYVVDADLNFVNSSRPRGLKTLLDTGSSLTYLPLDAVERMNKYLFINESTVKAPQGGLPPTETYEVRPDSWVLDSQSKVQVVYEFEGDGSTSVFVSGPLETFAYQDNPLHPGNPEGLVYPIGSSDKSGMGTLGQNFFQTMYVSLHKSTDGVDFVRLAGQWPERLQDDLRDYFVAGLSST